LPLHFLIETTHKTVPDLLGRRSLYPTITQRSGDAPAAAPGIRSRIDTVECLRLCGWTDAKFFHLVSAGFAPTMHIFPAIQFFAHSSLPLLQRNIHFTLKRANLTLVVIMIAEKLKAQASNQLKKVKNTPFSVT
jgi:hypothetical protein